MSVLSTAHSLNCSLRTRSAIAAVTGVNSRQVSRSGTYLDDVTCEGGVPGLNLVRGDCSEIRALVSEHAQQELQLFVLQEGLAQRVKQRACVEGVRADHVLSSGTWTGEISELQQEIDQTRLGTVHEGGLAALALVFVALEHVLSTCQCCLGTPANITLYSSLSCGSDSSKAMSSR